MLIETPVVEARCADLRTQIDNGGPAEQVAAAVLALGALGDGRVLSTLAAAAAHPSASVRRAVAEALPMAMMASGQDPDPGVSALVELSTDGDSEVRDWAVCSLGRTLASDPHVLRAHYDTPQIRAALAARLADPDPATRAEACAGLALRGVADGVVVDQLRTDLGRREVGRVPVLAAEALGRTELYEPLVALWSWWTRDPELLARAIHACAPPLDA